MGSLDLAAGKPPGGTGDCFREIVGHGPIYEEVIAGCPPVVPLLETVVREVVESAPDTQDVCKWGGYGTEPRLAGRVSPVEMKQQSVVALSGERRDVILQRHADLSVLVDAEEVGVHIVFREIERWERPNLGLYPVFHPVD